jgi:hypothetical protein
VFIGIERNRDKTTNSIRIMPRMWEEAGFNEQNKNKRPDAKTLTNARTLFHRSFAVLLAQVPPGAPSAGVWRHLRGPPRWMFGASLVLAA